MSTIQNSLGICVHSMTLGCLTYLIFFMNNEKKLRWGYRSLASLLTKPKVYSSLP